MYKLTLEFSLKQTDIIGRRYTWQQHYIAVKTSNEKQNRKTLHSEAWEIKQEKLKQANML